MTLAVRIQIEKRRYILNLIILGLLQFLFLGRGTRVDRLNAMKLPLIINKITDIFRLFRGTWYNRTGRVSNGESPSFLSPSTATTKIITTTTTNTTTINIYIQCIYASIYTRVFFFYFLFVCKPTYNHS